MFSVVLLYQKCMVPSTWTKTKFLQIHQMTLENAYLLARFITFIASVNLKSNSNTTISNDRYFIITGFTIVSMQVYWPHLLWLTGKNFPNRCSNSNSSNLDLVFISLAGLINAQ